VPEGKSNGFSKIEAAEIGFILEDELTKVLEDFVTHGLYFAGEVSE
jgi:hypothetical protein